MNREIKKHIGELFFLLKKNLAQLFILEFLFLFSHFFLFVYLKKKVQLVLQGLQSLNPQIEALQNIQERAAQNVALEKVLAGMGASTQETLLLLFVVVPLIVFALWILLQGWQWKTLNTEHIKSTQQYFKNITAITFIIFMLAFVLSIIAVPSVIFNLVAAFVLYHVLTITYNTTTQKKFFHSLVPAWKKSLKLIPWTFLLFVTSFALVFLFSVLFVSYITEEFLMFSPMMLIVYISFCCVLNIILKTAVSARMHKE